MTLSYGNNPGLSPHAISEMWGCGVSPCQDIYFVFLQCRDCSIDSVFKTKQWNASETGTSADISIFYRSVGSETYQK